MKQQVKGRIISSIYVVYFIDSNQNKYTFVFPLRSKIRDATPVKTDNGEIIESASSLGLVWKQLNAPLTTWESQMILATVDTTTSSSRHGWVIQWQLLD